MQFVKDNFFRMVFSAALASAPVTSAQSQDYTLACQYVAAGGLHWESGRWRATGFNLRTPFFLAISNGRIVPSSAQVAIGTFEVNCVGGPMESCTSPVGDTIFFDHELMEGAAARLFVHPPLANGSRDSLSVAYFICQRM
jgi:hypothetical protein